jgi:hypothetical protein
MHWLRAPLRNNHFVSPASSTHWIAIVLQLTHCATGRTNNRDCYKRINATHVVANPEGISGLVCSESAVRCSFWITANQHLSAIDGVRTGKLLALLFQQIDGRFASHRTVMRSASEGEKGEGTHGR